MWQQAGINLPASDRSRSSGKLLMKSEGYPGAVIRRSQFTQYRVPQLRIDATWIGFQLLLQLIDTKNHVSSISWREAFQLILAHWVRQVHRVVAHKTVIVDACPETKRVLADKSSGGWIVESSAVIIQSSFRVRFARGVLERIDQRARRGGQFAE